MTLNTGYRYLISHLPCVVCCVIMLTFALAFSGYLATSMFQLGGYTKHECAKKCSYSVNCSSFFFNTLTSTCQLEKFVHIKTSDLSVAQNVLYYVLKSDSCPEGYTYCRHTKQCLRRYDMMRTFSGANAVCEKDSGHLVFPRTLDANTQTVLMMGLSPVWIGAEQVTSNEWQWLDGQTVGPFSNWLIGRLNFGNAICIKMDKLWVDNMDYHKLNFICETEAVVVNMFDC